MDLGIENSAALVTASTSGLGLASAKSLVREGANVTICGRTEDRLTTAEEELLAIEGGDVLAVQADITQDEEIAALVEETVDTFGGLDHVVTSAGGVPSGPFLEMNDNDWYSAYDLLVMSHVRAVREAYPYLAESNSGSITAITSTSVKEAIDGLILSNAVRRAVIGVIKTVSRELSPEVRANAVLPAAHETPRIENLINQALDRGEYDNYEEGLDDWSSDIPMNRIGDPAELGDVVAFLSSPRASFVNGASIPVDGGRMRS